MLISGRRDCILRAFNLTLSDFHPVYIESKRVILIEVRHPESRDLFGFIRFQSNKDGYCVGGLQMANFKATLRYRNLGTGGTTKATDDGQTGQHGDGMKLSALVFRRNHYNVRYESSGFIWRMMYKKGSLHCSLSRMSEKSLTKIRQKAQGQDQSRTHVAYPWVDVCLIIDSPGAERNIYGHKMKAEVPHVNGFKEWLEVTLDINPPGKIIRTPHGDLIRDPRYQSHMYLKGLRLPNGGMSSKNYTYGYNLIKGTTTSDRDVLSGDGDESEGIKSIWAEAIRSDDSIDSEITDDYTKLLLNSLNEKGDVMLSHDELYLEEDIARKVWERMLIINKDAEGRQTFYYSASEGKDVSQHDEMANMQLTP
jgi:hypothetical protein